MTPDEARHVMWSAQTGGLEHLYLWRDGTDRLASGWVIGIHEGAPFRLAYGMRCDANWRVQHVWLEKVRERQDHEDDVRLDLHLSADNRWHGPGRAHYPKLDGCATVDIAATPFTNTLAIRHLNLQPGQSATIRLVYIDIPELNFYAAEQRYTCLKSNAKGSRYRFEALDGAFVAKIPFDADGVVQNYPGLFKRTR